MNIMMTFRVTTSLLGIWWFLHRAWGVKHVKWPDMFICATQTGSNQKCSNFTWIRRVLGTQRKFTVTESFLRNSEAMSPRPAPCSQSRTRSRLVRIWTALDQEKSPSDKQDHRRCFRCYKEHVSYCVKLVAVSILYSLHFLSAQWTLTSLQQGIEQGGVGKEEEVAEGLRGERRRKAGVPGELQWAAVHLHQSCHCGRKSGHVVLFLPLFSSSSSLCFTFTTLALLCCALFLPLLFTGERVGLQQCWQEGIQGLEEW